MFFKKQEKKSFRPWCIMIIGGLAVVGAISVTNKGKCFIREKTQAMMSFFKGKPEQSGNCMCSTDENL